MDDSIDDSTIKKLDIATLNRIDTNFEANCKRIANDLARSKTTMLEIVEKLNPYFFSTNVDEREEGVHVLSSILEFIPITTLRPEEVEQFCKFYSGRLNDNYKVIPAVLTGILTLSKYNQPMKCKCFMELLTTMFQTVSCQSQVHTERMKIYRIFKNMLLNQRAELLSYGLEFVYGVISAIDGERDPRNLMFLFKWLPEFITTVKLGHLSEEMFEVMACYFPVDFRVPSPDSNGIGRDALAKVLKQCLCASNDFAEQTVLLALEKLDSDLLIAKCDSLHLLLLGCEKFTNDAYVKFETGIWSALQKEMLKCPPAEVESLLLDVTTAISVKLSADQHRLDHVFGKVLATAVSNLNVMEKFFSPTCKLLLAMSSGNAACAERILTDVQPHLIALFHDAAAREHRVFAFRVLVEFLRVGDRYNANASNMAQFLTSLLRSDDDELHTSALQALCFLNAQFEEVKNALLADWEKLFVADAATEPLRGAFHQSILHYLNACPHEISALVESLPTNSAVMHNLCMLSSTQPFINVFLARCQAYFATETSICLRTLHTALCQHAGNAQFFASVQVSNLLATKVLQMQSLDFEQAQGCLMQFLGRCTVSQQAQFVHEHLPTALRRFHERGETHFLAGVLVNLHEENLEGCGDLLDALFEQACGGFLVAVQLLANLVNKLPDVVIEPFVERFAEILMVKEAQHACGVLCVWLTKALFMRGYHAKQRWTHLLMKYLHCTDAIADGMATILGDECVPLTVANHCRRRVLYKQTFFVEMCHLLDEHVGVVNNHNAMLAFAVLLRDVPSVILKLHFEKLVRLVTLCLDHSANAAGLVPILETIHGIIAAGDTLSEKYVEDFLPRLLRLASFDSAMKVRMLALQCIRLYANGVVPMHQLVKHQRAVTDALRACIDDRKRLVRKQAAEARLQWFLLGSPI